MAAVRIEASAWLDQRYHDLADDMGYSNHYEALGRMGEIWGQCTDRCIYVLPVRMIERILGPGGAVAMVNCSLGETVDDGIRVKGSRGRIEWLEKSRENGKKGGRPVKK